MIIELKYDQNAQNGIAQIKNKEYPKSLIYHLDDLLMISICYDKNTKVHQCVMERYE